MMTQRIRDAWWAVRHRIGKHRYHLIDTGLPPGYYDPDMRILHAVMAEVVRFVDGTRDTVNWDEEPGHRKAWQTLTDVADYWRSRLEAVDFDDEGEQSDMDNQMLHRIINVRAYMWYP